VTVDLVPILSTIVVLAMLMLVVLSYVLFRLREKHGPRPDGANAGGKQFFVRYHDAPKPGSSTPPKLG
jgi:hypothetical protein